MMSAIPGVPPRPLTLAIYRQRDPWLTLTVDPYATVSALKQLVAQHSGLMPSQHRLVFNGAVLAGEMSLSHYRIADGSRIYSLAVAAPPARPRPYQLLNRLWPLLDGLSAPDPARFVDAVCGIRDIIEDPAILSLARIDPVVRDAVDDAAALLAAARRPTSRRTRDFHARCQDQLLDQFEGAPDGMRVLQAIVDDAGEPEEAPPEPTRIRAAARICERPLPNPWAARRKDGALYASAVRLSFGEREPAARRDARIRFSEEVAALKDMGFRDEERILQALCETNGNVHLAAKLLQSRMG
jgi:hypothetical protein